MAEGGHEFKNPAYDQYFDHDDDDDDYDYDNDDNSQDPNETQPFQPGTASTPWPQGEQIEMQTMQHEQSGLSEESYLQPPSLEGFIHQDDKPARLERATEFIKSELPKVDFGKLGPIGFSKNPGNETTIVSFGTKGGETEIFRKDERGFLKKFTDKFKTSLGPVVIVRSTKLGIAKKQRVIKNRL